MLLLLDAGNSALGYAFYHQGRILKHGSIHNTDIPKFIKNCRFGGDCCHNHIVLTSVVPEITQTIRKSVVSKKCHLWVAGENLPLPIKHRYPKGKKPGTDRLVNSYGAFKIYGGPVLVLDFGTAFTVNYVSARGVFEGGMIIPGPELAFQALARRGAQLPKTIRIPKKSVTFLGRNTYEAMTSGILEGYGAMADGLIERFQKRYGRMKTLATGGLASTIMPHTRLIQKLDPHHTLKSLLLLFQEQVVQK